MLEGREGILGVDINFWTEWEVVFVDHWEECDVGCARGNVEDYRKKQQVSVEVNV